MKGEAAMRWLHRAAAGCRESSRQLLAWKHSPPSLPLKNMNRNHVGGKIPASEVSLEGQSTEARTRESTGCGRA